MAVTLVIAIIVAALVAEGVSYAMAPRPAAHTPQTIEVYMIAGDFGYDMFVPGSLVTGLGDTLVLHIVNTEDEAHDIHINAFNVHEDITPLTGSVTNVTFVASQTGTFAYVCEIHAPEMRGYLTVLE
jgi:plastocyanin